MKTTVEIAGPLFQQIKDLAVQEGVTFRVLVEEGLRSVVAARNQMQAKPFRLRDGSFQGGEGLQDGIRWNELAALAYEDEGGGIRP